MPLYDEDGNPIDGALTADEAKALQEKMAAAEAELTKLKSKDYNFAEFRKKTKEEQDELKSKMTERERMFQDQLEEMQNKLSERDNAVIEKTKSMYLDMVCGEDKEYRELIQKEYDRLPGETLTDDQVRAKLDEANALASFKVQKAKANLSSGLNNFAPFMGNPYQVGQPTNKSYADTPEGQALARDLGLSTGKQQ